MNDDHLARVSVHIDSEPMAVWDALVTPEAIQQYMFGATVTSDWTPGSRIVWAGEYQGRSYEDHGEILLIEPGELLSYTHFSPLTGLPDEPDNYHAVSIVLDDADDGTTVTLVQDNNSTDEAKQHSERNWATMLTSLKEYIEGNTRST